MLNKINQLKTEISVIKATSAEEAEELRIKYLSKKGIISALFDKFRNVPSNEKKEVGMALNQLKNEAQEKIAHLKEQFEQQNNIFCNQDLTRPGASYTIGTRHPV
jgi:phenylalanyl-tRNA synthetase alpha chain